MCKLRFLQCFSLWPSVAVDICNISCSFLPLIAFFCCLFSRIVPTLCVKCTCTAGHAIASWFESPWRQINWCSIGGRRLGGCAEVGLLESDFICAFSPRCWRGCRISSRLWMSDLFLIHFPGLYPCSLSRWMLHTAVFLFLMAWTVTWLSNVVCQTAWPSANRGEKIHLLWEPGEMQLIMLLQPRCLNNESEPQRLNHFQQQFMGYPLTHFNRFRMLNYL